MNLEKLRARALQRAAAAFEGQWHSIEFQPDLFVHQRFCVGVLAYGAGQADFRLMRTMGKFTCVYGSKIAESELQWALGEAAALLDVQRGEICERGIQKLDLGSPHFRLSEGRFVRGSSITGVVGRLFEEQVAMAIHQRDPDPLFSTQENPLVRQTIRRLVKERAMLQFERIAVPEEGVMVKDGDRLHTFNLDFDDGVRIGSVVSAWTTQRSTFEMNLLRAESDLFNYQRIRNKQHVALFIKMPDADTAWPKEARKNVLKFWDEEEWKLEQAGVRVITSSADDQLADSVLEFYQLG